MAGEQTSGFLSGAASGAAAGAALGPYGALAGGAIGGLAGLFGGKSAKAGQKKADAKYLEAKNTLLQTQQDAKLQSAQETDRLLGVYGNLGQAPQSAAAQGDAAGTLAQLGILSPWMNQSMAGFGQQLFGANAQQSAITGMQNLSANPGAILNDPLYQTQLNAGVRGAEMGAAARGTQLSGGQLANLQELSQNTAGNVLQQRMAQLGQQAQAGAQFSQSGLGLANLGANLAGNQAQLGVQAEQAFGLQNLQNQQQVNLANQQAVQQQNQLGLGYNQLIAQNKQAGVGAQVDLGGSLASLAAGQGAAAAAQGANQQAGLMNLVGSLGGAAIGAAGKK